MMKRNFKNKLAILFATLTLNTLNAPKAASWSAIRTLSKAVLGACIIVSSTKCYRHISSNYISSNYISSNYISSNYIYNFKNKNKNIEEIKKYFRTRELFEYILTFFEFALVDIVVDKVADKVADQMGDKKAKIVKNEENSSHAGRANKVK